MAASSRRQLYGDGAADGAPSPPLPLEGDAVVTTRYCCVRAVVLTAIWWHGGSMLTIRRPHGCNVWEGSTVLDEPL